jgi:hypothetical protein
MMCTCAHISVETEMNSKAIKRWQAKRILDVLRPTRGYLHQLKCRMEKVGFLPGDPLFRCVERADSSMLELCMALHYMTCEGGMGFNQGSDQSDGKHGPP